MQRALFLFRRDLRLEDNTGLIFALESSELVIPAFILTPEQIDHNPYRSDHCLQFMIESLHDLDEQLKAKGSKLYLFKGHPEEIVTKLKIDGLVINRDYTPYSIQRDKKLEKACKSHGIAFHSFDDALLHPPEETVKSNGEPYSVFTPYFRNASKGKVAPPVSNRKTNYFHGTLPHSESLSILSKILPKKSTKTTLKGGRTEALKILRKLGSLTQYEKLRDFPEEEYSSHLSPYLKFNVISIREAHAAICKHLNSHHGLIRSLYWRDFFSTIAFFFPHVFKGAFHEKFDKVKWSNSKKLFNLWCEGQTGVPIVDAGMREMNETGFMHNRVRMIAGSFLVKDLHINWQWGEKYFAQTLIDYDPAVNNGNWQWVASTGCDAQPYFRIFNPWNQQKKFDPDCTYIKKWVPELSKLPAHIIHAWDNEDYHDECPDYPAPIVSHQSASKEALQAYKSIR